MIQICEETQLEIMKFFMTTSVPKILNEKKSIISN